jgi:hypothetical protein
MAVFRRIMRVVVVLICHSINKVEPRVVEGQQKSGR